MPTNPFKCNTTSDYATRIGEHTQPQENGASLGNTRWISNADYWHIQSFLLSTSNFWDKFKPATGMQATQTFRQSTLARFAAHVATDLQRGLKQVGS
ncbi:MAG: hypothetical protein VKJ05_08590 [Synechococcaceae cyanobacterium]|nr:hypothetical protein [Synechococcaceae cyanobacterium]